MSARTPTELKNYKYRSTVFVCPSATTASFATTSDSATTSTSTSTFVPTTSIPSVATSTSVPTTHPTDDSVIFSPLDDSGNIERRQLVSTEHEPTFRTRLRLEQDVAFHLSLRADQQRALDQQQEREIRQSRRQQRVEEMNRMLEEIGPEPLEGFQITFRLPDGNRVTRKFEENAPMKVLFLFVEGKYSIRITKLLGPDGVVLAKSEIPLNTSINVNSIVTVESENLALDGDDSDNEVNVEPEARKLDMLELESRRKQAFLYLCSAKKITVDRKNIIETVLIAYRGNLELEHHKLEIELENEIGLDLTGVTKEMFHLFFSAFAEKYMVGHLQKVPGNDHRYHCTDLYRTMGRILVHAYILCGYWPVQFSSATMIAALTANVSEEVILNSFLDMLTEREGELVKRLLRGETSEDEHLRILGLLTRFDCRQQISKNNARNVLLSLAGAVTIYRPYHAILQIGQGLSSYNNLWSGVEEEHILNLYKRASPSASKISEKMEPFFSNEDNDKRVMEEQVINFLETWMASLTPNELMQFLIYWTASNVSLPDQSLRVEFNSLQGLARRPTATTCTDTLSLSRYYYGQEDFNSDMTIVFSSESKVMDAL